MPDPRVHTEVLAMLETAVSEHLELAFGVSAQRGFVDAEPVNDQSPRCGKPLLDVVYEHA